jgi:imidazolonepropionase-like amidohydrolase
VVLEYHARLDDTAFVRRPELRHIPAAMRRWATSVEAVRRPATDGGYERRLMAAHLRAVGEMHRAGVRILAGSDAPNPFTVPGFALHRELELLVQAGLSPMEALRAATSEPARFMGVADSVGSVAEGHAADLVLLDADPLADIRNTLRIRAVVSGGMALDSAALAAMRQEAARAADRAPPGSGALEPHMHAERPR